MGRATILTAAIFCCVIFVCSCQPREETQGGAPVEGGRPSAEGHSPGNAPQPSPTGGSVDFNDAQRDASAKMNRDSILASIRRMYEGFDPDKMYGMSLYDASDSLMHVYRWNADGTEYVVNSVSNGGLMFSGPAWSEGSKCIGAFVEFEAVFGGWNGEGISPTAVEAFSGGGAAWAPGDAEEAPRYEFKLGEGKVKIYADEDGTKLMENTPVLVQLGKEDVIGPFKPREIGGNFPGDLQGAHWDAIANYAARLGETKEAVAKEKNPYFVEDMYGQDCYADDEGVLYRYASTADSDEKSCVRVEVPAAKIFPGLRQNDIEPYEFLRMVGIRAAWYVDGHYPQYLTGTEWVTDREADGECVYVLNAPIGGARVSVSSGINGNIRERDRVFMKSAVE